MMPARASFVITEALRSNHVTQGNSASSDWLNYALLIAGILVAVGIAAWQHRDLRIYRQADRLREAEQAEREAERAEQDSLRQARRASRESWELEFTETQAILNKVEDFESEVRNQGPLNRDAVDRAELSKIQWRLENACRRVPAALRDPLNEVAAAIAKLRSITVPSDADVVQAYAETLTRTPACDPAPKFLPSAIGATAVQQYRAAVDLHEAIGTAWRIIYTERGGGS